MKARSEDIAKPIALAVYSTKETDGQANPDSFSCVVWVYIPTMQCHSGHSWDGRGRPSTGCQGPSGPGACWIANGHEVPDACCGRVALIAAAPPGCVCMLCVRVRVCACVCVCVWEGWGDIGAVIFSNIDVASSGCKW